jgi:hypothetical protein
VRTTLALAAAASLALGALSTGPVGAGTADTSASSRAAGATPLGQVGAPTPCGVTGPGAVVANTLAAGTPSYTAPFNGVVTRFSHQANNIPGRVQAIVFADGATASEKTVVARSPKVAVTTNALNSFAVRLPMQEGTRLGLGYTVTGMGCATAAGYAGDSTWIRGSFDPDTIAGFVAAGILSDGVHTLRPNIGAVLEPDVDGDGYGDVTQDACPASAYTQAVCPVPDTRITKRPEHKSTSRKIKVTVAFVATVPGSTFQCRVDTHRSWIPCASPFKRRFGPGRHRVQVLAVSPVGVVESEPATATFTIARVGHHH